MMGRSVLRESTTKTTFTSALTRRARSRAYWNAVRELSEPSMPATTWPITPAASPRPRAGLPSEAGVLGMELRQLVLFQQEADRIVDPLGAVGVVAFPDHLVQPFEQLGRGFHVRLRHCQPSLSRAGRILPRPRSRRNHSSRALILPRPADEIKSAHPWLRGAFRTSMYSAPLGIRGYGSTLCGILSTWPRGTASTAHRTPRTIPIPGRPGGSGTGPGSSGAHCGGNRAGHPRPRGRRRRAGSAGACARAAPRQRPPRSPSCRRWPRSPRAGIPAPGRTG